MCNPTKLIQIFIDCDDFCQSFEPILQQYFLPPPSPKSHRKPSLSHSEIMAILIFYHLSHMKCFRAYYHAIILNKFRSYFPLAPSYNRFVELIPRSLFLLIMFLRMSRRGTETGIYFADSTKIAVCHNLRISSHKVFQGIAQRGKTSVGWFYGMKLFLVINEKGEIMECRLTSGNVADNNYSFLSRLLRGLKGKVFADKGFLSQKVFKECLGKGLKVVTKLRENMRNRLLEMEERVLLMKRGVIESVIDILKKGCDIEHSRHRSAVNGIVNIFAGVIAYTYLDTLPSITIAEK